MAQSCKVCGHPRRKEIETEILTKMRGKKRIGEIYGISEGSVRRHARVCMGLSGEKKLTGEPPRPPAAQLERDLGVAMNLEQKVQDLIHEAADIGQEARDKKDLRTALFAIERQERLIHTMGNLALRKAELDARDEGIKIEIELVEGTGGNGQG